MKQPPVPFDSDALRANIASTAQDMVIPDRYQPLVDAVEGLYGVRASLVETIGEYFHAYRNADLLIEGFQTTLLRNWAHFEAADDRATLFGLLADLVLGLLDSALSPEQFSLSLRGLLMWCAAAVSGPHGEAYDDSLAGVATALADARRPPAGRLSRARHAAARPGRAGRRAAGARPRLLRALSRRPAARLPAPRGAPRRAELGDRPGDRADRPGGGRRALRLSLGRAPARSHPRRRRGARRAAPRPRVPAVLGAARPGHRPALRHRRRSRTASPSASSS